MQPSHISDVAHCGNRNYLYGMQTDPTYSVLLVAHGSETNPRSSFAVFDCSARLSAALEVRVDVAFWKGEPTLTGAIDRMPKEPIIVVPFFMADGFYSRSRVPEALGLNESRRDVRYTQPIGTSDAFARFVLTIVADVPSRLVVVGHGTSRSETSRDSALALVTFLRNNQVDAFAAFLDDDPKIDSIVENGDVILPMFVSDGDHVQNDIVSRFPKTIVLEPVGTLTGIDSVISMLIEDALKG